MISGNGRHRRPRQAPALLVAAGVTGSAIAIPLLGAASAHAADGTTWDKVANCESGGAWSADPGNGYYGGLQISQDDWVAYGGTQYASAADPAAERARAALTVPRAGHRDGRRRMRATRRASTSSTRLLRPDRATRPHPEGEVVRLLRETPSGRAGATAAG